ncbi:peptide/nickel transport system ATP-binding protein [Rhodoligotrophos appendicifer]|uniref:dipeptide ABC transporter ATP-binding protein n=1 Tax=Rhodoligotrophos appendicifer TaxID=987056 RepID=UPI00118625C8
MAVTAIEPRLSAPPSPEIVPVLDCRDVSISYTTRAGQIPAVIDFNLQVMPGEAVGIVGESGCGKSTVALAIMNYMGRNGAITGGEILFQGRDMRLMSEAELQQVRGKDISMVYQEPMASLNPSLRVSEQLTEVLIYHEGLTEADARLRATSMLDAVRLPDAGRILSSFPHQLSGGQQQRVLIAMALLSRPKLLLLDEPTTALDVTVEAGIVELIKEIAREFGTSMVYISHNLGLILETCDRVTVMYSGQAVEQGTVSQVFDQMRHPYTRGLFNSIPLPGTDRYARPLVPIRGQLPLPHERPKGCYFGPRCDFFQAGRCDAQLIPMEPVAHEDSHGVRCVRYREIDWHAEAPIAVRNDPMRIGDTVLEVQNMTKHYEIRDNSLRALLTGRRKRYVKANERISFEAREAETVAIVGESGCGKTTFAKVLMGLEEATSGRILLHGKDIANLPVEKRSPKLIGDLQIVFQNPFETLNPSHTIGSQISRVIKKFGVAKTKADVRRQMFQMLDMVKLPRDFAFRKPRQLSGGQKQRVGIARAFGGDAAVVVADEPVSALDVSVQAAITGLLTEIQREKRTTMLFISHDLSVVRYLADRVVVMYLGQIMEQGTTDQVFNPPYHPYTEALLSAVPIADTSITKKHIVLSGELPSPMNPPPGCPFQTRCPRKIGAICETKAPPRKELALGHTILCHLPDEELRAMEPVIAIGAPRSKPAEAEVARFPEIQTPPRPTTPVAERAEPLLDGDPAGHHQSAPPSRSEVATEAAVAGQMPTEARATELDGPAAEDTGIFEGARIDEGPAAGTPALEDRDDLTRIKGIDEERQKLLHAIGVYDIASIARWSEDDIQRVKSALGLKRRTQADTWKKRAGELVAGEAVAGEDAPV